MNKEIIHYCLLIGFTVFGIFKNSLSLNPIRFHCDNYILNTYLYFILSWGIIMATNSVLKLHDVKLKDLFSGPFTILLALASIMLLFALMVVPPQLFLTKHALYITEIVLLGILLYPYYITNTSLFYHVGITTFLILLCLSTFVYLFPDIVKDSWGTYLLIALFSLIISRVVEIFITIKYPEYKTNNKAISYISIIIFSLILMYDTKKIIVNAENCYNPDYINESLSLLLDSINIFSNLFVINDI